MKAHEAYSKSDDNNRQAHSRGILSNGRVDAASRALAWHEAQASLPAYVERSLSETGCKVRMGAADGGEAGRQPSVVVRTAAKVKRAKALTNQGESLLGTSFKVIANY